MTTTPNGLYRVVIRRHLAKVRPNAEQIDGKVFYLTYGWRLTKDDSSLYVGEIAMIPQLNGGMYHAATDPYPVDGPSWIASGDLEKV